MNTYSEFQVNIFSNNRDITKCQFLHHDDAKAIAIPRVFSENIPGKNAGLSHLVLVCAGCNGQRLANGQFSVPQGPVYLFLWLVNKQIGFYTTSNIFFSDISQRLLKY